VYSFKSQVSSPRRKPIRKGGKGEKKGLSVVTDWDLKQNPGRYSMGNPERWGTANNRGEGGACPV